MVALARMPVKSWRNDRRFGDIRESGYTRHVGQPSKPRKLLIASIGVATVNYVASCGSNVSPTTGNLPLGGRFSAGGIVTSGGTTGGSKAAGGTSAGTTTSGGIPPTSGNLVPPPTGGTPSSGGGGGTLAGGAGGEAESGDGGVPSSAGKR
jgi:hypothetical protein